MKDGQQYVYIFIAIITLGFTGWYYAQQDNLSSHVSKKVLSHLPDVIISTLKVKQFNEQGLPANQFETPQLTHFPYNNSSKFISPHIILHSEKGEPWFIQSERGESEQGTTKITLIDQVILHQNASETEKEKTITTSEMSYFPEKNWAETNKMVFFEEPGLRIQSEGMTANLKEQKINLSQHVTSEYIPNESQ